MKLCFDVKECENQKISVDTAFYIASLYFGKCINNNSFQEACSKGLIEFDRYDLFKKEPVNPRLTPQGTELIETIFLNSEFKENKKEDRFDILAKRLQEVFPVGRKPGTNLMWRDSQSIISKRLKAVIKKYGVEFTDEQAIDATKKYVESFNGDYQFMQVLKYFLCKKNLLTGEENSQFLSYIENAGSEEELNNSWRNKVR